MFGLFTAGISAIGNAAKNLFSGEAKAARQQAKAVKKEAKEAAKEAKEAAKKAITGGGVAGAKVGQIASSVWNWIKTNWIMIVAVIGTVVTIYLLFFSKKRTSRTTRRRSSGASRGSSEMKARMAKVRAARRRKRK